METKFMDLAKKRRSIYDLGRNVTMSEADLTTLIEENIKNAPSSFNNQTTRAVILFGASHEKLWDIVIDRLKQEVPNEAAFAKTSAKINAFKAAFGTVMYFTETKTVKGRIVKSNATIVQRKLQLGTSSPRPCVVGYLTPG